MVMWLNGARKWNDTVISGTGIGWFPHRYIWKTVLVFREMTVSAREGQVSVLGDFGRPYSQYLLGTRVDLFCRRLAPEIVRSDGGMEFVASGLLFCRRCLLAHSKERRRLFRLVGEIKRPSCQVAGGERRNFYKT